MKVPSDKYLKFMMSDKNLLLLSNNEFTQFDDIFDTFHSFVVNNITEITIHHIDAILMQEDADIVIMNCCSSAQLIIEIIERIRDFSENIKIILIIPSSNLSKYVETINNVDFILTDNFTTENLSEKLVACLSDNCSVKTTLNIQDKSEGNEKIEIFLDTFEGEILFLIEELKNFVKRLEDGELSKKLLKEISTKMQEVAAVFSRHTYTKEVSPIFINLGIYLDLLEIQNIKIENIEGFEYLTRIIDDISSYLFEYFVSRVFVDVYLFQDSLKNSVQFMKNRLKTDDTSNDSSELSFFDD